MIDPAAWSRPAAFAWLDAHAVPEEEQRRVFNLGIGYCAIVPAAQAALAGEAVIGRVEAGVDGVAFAD